MTTCNVSETMAGALLTIDLDAIVGNYRLLVARTAPALVGAVVKADAYGLGAVPVSRALSSAGCRQFFVAQLPEALLLRPHLAASDDIFVMNGLPRGAAPACRDGGAIPVLNSLDQLRQWSALAVASARRLPAAIQIDSGMSRLGLAEADIDQLLGDPAPLDNLDVRLVMSHLACADDRDAAANARQLATFDRIGARIGPYRRSLANSGGAFLAAAFHNDVVRAGIALYGGSPIAHGANPMLPVVALDAPVIQIRSIAPGEGVGYGLSFVARTPRLIATIGVGYADGWPRSLSNVGSAYIAGIRVPIAGRVSMDSITFDVTDVPAAALGPDARVELLGKHQTIDQVAAAAGTISYEILTQLGHRYARRYLPCGKQIP